MHRQNAHFIRKKEVRIYLSPADISLRDRCISSRRNDFRPAGLAACHTRVHSPSARPGNRRLRSWGEENSFRRSPMASTESKPASRRKLAQSTASSSLKLTERSHWYTKPCGKPGPVSILAIEWIEGRGLVGTSGKMQVWRGNETISEGITRSYQTTKGQYTMLRVFFFREQCVRGLKFL
jgi:hypothetical protein